METIVTGKQYWYEANFVANGKHSAIRIPCFVVGYVMNDRSMVKYMSLTSGCLETHTVYNSSLFTEPYKPTLQDMKDVVDNTFTVTTDASELYTNGIAIASVEDLLPHMTPFWKNALASEDPENAEICLNPYNDSESEDRESNCFKEGFETAIKWKRIMHDIKAAKEMSSVGMFTAIPIMNNGIMQDLANEKKLVDELSSKLDVLEKHNEELKDRIKQMNANEPEVWYRMEKFEERYKEMKAEIDSYKSKQQVPVVSEERLFSAFEAGCEVYYDDNDGRTSMSESVVKKAFERFKLSLPVDKEENSISEEEMVSLLKIALHVS